MEGVDAKDKENPPARRGKLQAPPPGVPAIVGGDGDGDGEDDGVDSGEGGDARHDGEGDDEAADGGGHSPAGSAGDPDGEEEGSEDASKFEEDLEKEMDRLGLTTKNSAPRVDEEERVRRAAWSLFEVLLPRCVGLEGQGLETRLEEPTAFSRRCAPAIGSRVRRYVVCVCPSFPDLAGRGVPLPTV